MAAHPRRMNDQETGGPPALRAVHGDHGDRGDRGEHMGRTGEHEDHRAMLREHHERMLWTTLTSIVSGLWLIGSIFAVDYQSTALRWSDAISGLVIVAFGVVALSPRLDLARWGI